MGLIRRCAQNAHGMWHDMTWPGDGWPLEGDRQWNHRTKSNKFLSEYFSFVAEEHYCYLSKKIFALEKNTSAIKYVWTGLSDRLLRPILVIKYEIMVGELLVTGWPKWKTFTLSVAWSYYYIGEGACCRILIRSDALHSTVYMLARSLTHARTHTILSTQISLFFFE